MMNSKLFIVFLCFGLQPQLLATDSPAIVTAICKDVTIGLYDDLFPGNFDNGSTDSEGNPLTFEILEFPCMPFCTFTSCNDTGSMVITLRVSNGLGDFDDCQALLRIVDDIPPVFDSGCNSSFTYDLPVGDCTQDVVVDWVGSLQDNCGNAVIDFRYIEVDKDNGDPMGDWSEYFSWGTTISFYAGKYNVEFRTIDQAGNFNVCDNSVFIRDVTSPVAICGNVTVNIGPDGNAEVLASEIPNHSYDDCGSTVVVSSFQYDCDDAGLNLIELVTVEDEFGNSSIAPINVSITNIFPPPIIECQDLAIPMPASGFTDPVGSNIFIQTVQENDPCVVATPAIYPSNFIFNCSDGYVQEVFLTATDHDNQSSLCPSLVTLVSEVSFDEFQVIGGQGSNYIGLCSGESVSFEILSSFPVGVPERNIEYIISDGLNEFSVNGMSTITHTFTPDPSPSDIVLTLVRIKSAIGCEFPMNDIPLEERSIYIYNRGIDPGSIGTNTTFCNPSDAPVISSLDDGDVTEYQWELSTDNVNFNPIPSAIQNVYDPGIISITSHYRRKASKTFNINAHGNFSFTCDQYSDTVSYTVEHIQITSHPQDQVICEGDQVILQSVGETLGSGQVLYQWQVNEGMDFNDIPGETSSSLVFNNADPSLVGKVFRVAVYLHENCIIYSNPATIAVFQLPVIDDQPQDQLFCLGENVEFSVSVTEGQGMNNDLLYQWQVDEGSGFNNIPGAISSSLFLNNLQSSFDGNIYRVMVEEVNGSDPNCYVISNPATLIETSIPTIDGQPPAFSNVCDGENTTLSVIATSSGGTLDYLWQQYNDNTLQWDDIPNSNSSYYIAGPIYFPLEFRAIVSISGICQVVSNSSTVIPSPPTLPLEDAINVCSTTASNYDLDALALLWLGGDPSLTIGWYEGQPSSGGQLISPSNAVDLIQISDLWIEVTNGVPCIGEKEISVNIFNPPSTIGDPIYVNESVSGGNHTGLNWSQAFDNLSDAISVAKSCGSGYPIWVAEGNYYPGNNMGIMIDHLDIEIYGGFSGIETDVNQRNVLQNSTIFNADFMGDDIYFNDPNHPDWPVINTADNAERIFSFSGSMHPVTIDGIFFRGAKIMAVEAFGIDLALRNCVFEYNDAAAGALTLLESTYEVSHCYFLNNRSGAPGGAVEITGSMASPARKSSTSRSIDSYIHNSLFVNNHSNFSGGAIQLRDISTGIFNCTFYNNLTTGSGNSLHTESINPQNVHLVNSVFWGSSSEISSIAPVSTHLSYSIVQDDVQDGTLDLPPDIIDVGNNLDADPNFINPLNIMGYDGQVGTVDDGFQLNSCSPGVNSGDNGGSGALYDLANNSRVYQTTIDIGAYESQVDFNSHTIWKGTNHNGWHDPVNWSCGVPGNNLGVSIFYPHGHHPTINLGNASCRSLFLGSSVDLSILPGNTLSIIE